MNILFGTPIYSDPSVLQTPTFGGGSWSATLPLTNLQDRRLSKVARSSDALVTSTKFTCSLLGAGSTNRLVGLVAIPKHTISSVGTIRVRCINGGPGAAGLVLDFGTGWTAVGTPTRSAAAFTGTDGVPLDLIGDDTAAALEGYTRVFAMGTTGQVKSINIRVKQGTSTSSVIRVRDTSAGADRLLGVLTWSAGLPVLTMSTGTFVGYTAIGGAFRLAFLTTAVTTANTNQIEVYPATGSALAVGATGDLYVGDLDAYFVTTDRLVTDSGYVTPWPTGMTAEDVNGLNVPFVHIPTQGVFANPAGTTTGTVQVDINDTTNSAGYVDLARLVIAGAYQPAINLNYGAQLGLESDTTRTLTDGGAALYNARPVRRTLTGVLENITDAEAFGSYFAMQQRHGLSNQLFVVFDPADAAASLLWRRSFLCVFRSLSALENATLARNRAAFSLVEEL